MQELEYGEERSQTTLPLPYGGVRALVLKLFFIYGFDYLRRKTFYLSPKKLGVAIFLLAPLSIS